MSYRLSIAPEVEEDGHVAETWYEERSPGLGDRFLDDLYSGLAAILEDPLLHGPFEDRVRRRLLIRFPYAIYYTVDSDTIAVWAVLHCARNPQWITDVLGDRGN